MPTNNIKRLYWLRKSSLLNMSTSKWTLFLFDGNRKYYQTALSLASTFWVLNRVLPKAYACLVLNNVQCLTRTLIIWSWHINLKSLKNLQDSCVMLLSYQKNVTKYQTRLFLLILKDASIVFQNQFSRYDLVCDSKIITKNNVLEHFFGQCR